MELEFDDDEYETEKVEICKMLFKCYYSYMFI
jgi:hypothetical protein